MRLAISLPGLVLLLVLVLHHIYTFIVKPMKMFHLKMLLKDIELVQKKLIS